MEKIYYTWDEFDRDISLLSDELKNKEFEFIVGLTRGGSVLATALSYSLNVPVKYVSPDDSDFFKFLYWHQCLIVDDINDTGKTLEKVKLYMSSFDHYYLTIFNKKTSISKVDYFAREIKEEDNNKWIQFPWEKQYNNLEQ